MMTNKPDYFSPEEGSSLLQAVETSSIALNLFFSTERFMVFDLAVKLCDISNASLPEAVAVIESLVEQFKSLVTENNDGTVSVKHEKTVTRDDNMAMFWNLANKKG